MVFSRNTYLNNKKSCLMQDFFMVEAINYTLPLAIAIFAESSMVCWTGMFI